MGSDLTRSLYDLLTEKYNIVPSRARQQIEAGICDRHEAEILKMPLNTPVLHLTRLSLDQFDQPFEYVKSTYRGDKYIFDVELQAG